MTEHPQPAWHWPHYDHTLCGTENDRQRLGLPTYYLADRLQTHFSPLFVAMASWSAARLTAHCENPEICIEERIVAGEILALMGDPRIVTLSPTMVTIPGATIHIGLDVSAIAQVMATFSGLGLNPDWIRKECPRFLVSIPTFAIGKYPVTNQEYADFLLDTHHSELPDSWAFRRFPRERANHPVYTLSPQDAECYCQWLSEKTGRQFRLPGEYEWEYAASGGDGREFPWGNHFADDRANILETGLFTTSPVGVFPRGNSPFGVADMAGNVEEYVADNYHPYPDGDTISDHLTEIHGQYRIARGGSFARLRDLARTRRRHGHNPRSATYAMGFRLAESLAL